MTIITNRYLNGRVYHVEQTGRNVIVDTIQGTFGPVLTGIRTDSYRIPR